MVAVFGRSPKKVLVDLLVKPAVREKPAVPQPRAMQSLMTKVSNVYKTAQTETAPMLGEAQKWLVDLDEQWQTFIQKYVDPRFRGAQYRQHKTELGMEISEKEKDANRRILLSIGNIGLALAATHLFPPLGIANFVFSAWLAMPIYQRGLFVLLKQRRLSYPIVLIGGELATYLGGYFVPASVGILLAMVTQKLISDTEDHYQRDFVSIFEVPTHTVWLLVEGSEVEIPFTAIKQGDILVIEAGQTVPVDGIITAGSATIDQRMLTGESQPAEKGVGDEVLAATLVLAGKLYVRVEKTGEETGVAQIAAVLQNAAQFKLNFVSRVQNFNDRLVAPLLLVGGIFWVTLGPWAAASIMSLGVGMVARVGGPLTMLSYMNIASRRGILIKDARSLETFKQVDTIVFDKTGTLTLEELELASIVPCGRLDEKTLLQYAAAAESKQTHPVAQAILVAAAERSIESLTIEDAHYEVGYGIKVMIDQQVVRVGSQRFMEMEGIAVTTSLEQLQKEIHHKGHSLIMVAVGQQVAGTLELAPTVRPEAKQAVADLQAKGLELYIISGDHEAPTRYLAQELGISHYYAGVLPHEKAELVASLQTDGRTVCFVGDGINDAIALSKAPVSISLRGATTIATDTAQIVLMGQDLRQLAFLSDIAYDFDQKLHQLFRLTALPLIVVASTTFLLHTGIYFSILVAGVGFWSGVGIALSPLRKFAAETTTKATKASVL